MRLARDLAACLVAAVATVGAASAAGAAVTDPAPLVCTNGVTYSVTAGDAATRSTSPEATAPS
jgi:hypothetical protein